jgi:hypothetical protein
MASRSTSRTVTFRHAFFLRGMDRMQPAGEYTVDTDEESIETRLGVAYRRVGTWIWLPSKLASRGEIRMTSVDPQELDAALVVDARQAQAVQR